MKDNLLKLLNNNLNNYMKENETKTLAYAREMTLESAKEKGLILDYKLDTYSNDFKNDNILYFGSCAGFDKRYKVIIK